MISIIPREEWSDSITVVRALFPVKGIVLHHSATDNATPLQGDAEKSRFLKEVQQMHDYHVHTRGWQDIGYHFLISRGGLIVEGRRLSHLVLRDRKMPAGSHCPTKNTTHVGICLEGDYQSTRLLPNSQWESLVRLMAYIAFVCGFPLDRSTVLLHREVRATACPGDTVAEKIDAILAHANRVKSKISGGK